MKASFSTITGLFVALFLISGCAGPSIGLQTDFKQANFEVNKTKKDDVVDRLGLPQKSMHDTEGREHYFYEGSTHLLGACIGCGNTSGSVGLIPSMINQAQISNGAEFVFDQNGILVAKYIAK